MHAKDSSRPTSPIPRILGRAIEPLYRFEINRRNRAFDQAKRITRLRQPVVSIGNLSVGGTGKTPMVAQIVRWLREAGHDPAIAMRGYKSAGGRSDEAEAYARAFDDLPIVAQPDRLAGLLALLETPRGNRIDCIVLDDGFQHRKIARDLDIVLIDASRNPFTDRLLPAGWLREPVTSLARADAVVVTHAELMTRRPMTRELWFPLTLRLGKGKPIALTRHAWTALDVLADGEDRHQPVEWLRAKRILALCAIGNPHAFTEAARAATCSSKGEGEVTPMILPDHDPYREKTIARAIQAAQGLDAIVTTDKDWSKLREVAPDRWPCPIVRPRLRLTFDRGEAELHRAVLSAVEGTDEAR